MTSTYRLMYRQFKLPVYIFIFCLLSSCQSKRSKEETNIRSDSIITKSVNVSSDNKDDTLITTTCALIIYPTDKQIKEIKKSYKDSNDFYTVADDNQFYMWTSSKVLDSLKIKTLTRDAKGIVSFKTNTGQTFKIQLDTLHWGIILFNGKDKPKNADILDIELDYQRYMLR